ncbi:MAG: DUF2442 domain-containing protein [Chitinivibrionales bacterium]|nr:DUF2442 domain-containing protein [Chitinivibrionales bacterium]
MECITVSQARYVQDYRIWIEFSTGESGEADLKELVFKFPIATSLRDPVKFAKFHLDEWPTLAWDCGFDVDPEYLYEIVTGKPTPEPMKEMLR